VIGKKDTVNLDKRIKLGLDWFGSFDYAQNKFAHHKFMIWLRLMRATHVGKLLGDKI
jgi:hypothetical protein